MINILHRYNNKYHYYDIIFYSIKQDLYQKSKLLDKSLRLQNSKTFLLMSNQNSQLKKQPQSTPINSIHKDLPKTTAPKAIFIQTEQNQQEKQSNHSNKQSFDALSFQPSPKIPKNIKKGNIKTYQSQNDHQLQIKRIALLQNTISEYKSEALLLVNKLAERQNILKLLKQNYDKQISGYKSTILSIQKQLQGQNKLIQEYLDKYDFYTNQNQKYLKIINEQAKIIEQLNLQIKLLQKTGNNAKQVTLNCIQQKQTLKTQLIIEKEKYQILFKDYQNLSLNHQNQIKSLTQQNTKLIRKLQDLQMEIKIYQKDKEIEKLLVLEETIQKRQKQLFKSHEKQNSIDSLKQYIPRKLDFQNSPKFQQNNENKQNDQRKISQLQQVIELQKKKIQNLQNQLKTTQKRNKELQQLMVKLMK